MGYGYVTKIKPAKKLLDEQKENAGMKKEENNVEKQLENLTVSNWSSAWFLCILLTIDPIFNFI